MIPNPTLLATKLPLFASQKGFPASQAVFQFKQSHQHITHHHLRYLCLLLCQKPCQLVLCTTREEKGNMQKPHLSCAISYAICVLTCASRSMRVCAGAGLGDEVCVSLPSTVHSPANFSYPKPCYGINYPLKQVEFAHQQVGKPA